MLTEPDINQEVLKKKINENCDLRIEKLSFIPRGETSFVYKADSPSESYIIKLIPSSTFESLELTHSLNIAEKLAQDFNIPSVVAPIRLKNLDLFFGFQTFQVIIYPFITGNNFSQYNCSKESLQSLAQSLAQLHSLPLTAFLEFPLKKETLSTHVDTKLAKCFAHIENPNNLLTDYQQKIADILLPRKEKIVHQLEQLKIHQLASLKDKRPYALTHGDTVYDNLLLDEKGMVHILDWDGIQFAPIERDLLYFLKSDFVVVMDAYQKIFGEVRLLEEVILFYKYKRYLEDLEDWTSRILFENNSDEQNQGDLDGIIVVCLPDFENIQQESLYLKDIIQDYC